MKSPVHAGRKVLIVGDSHTVGHFGKVLDQICRDQGAFVRTYASCGSHPIWWFDGTRTHCGYFARNENGKVERVPFGQLKPTPRLPRIWQQYQPDLVIVALGANMIDYTQQTITGTATKMALYLHNKGTKVYWIGPPVVRLQPRWKLDRLYGWLRKAVEPYACFIDSRPWTAYPESGGDGIHYRGAEGRKIAENWAKAAFSAIQQYPEHGSHALDGID